MAHQKFLKVSEAYRRIVDPCDIMDDIPAPSSANGDEYYEDEDYETMFAFRMFERMFSFNGGGFRGDRRNTCNCWECRNSRNFFIPKPTARYVPKSQRPKDPKEEEKKKSAAQNTINPHENWLSDEEKPPKNKKTSIAHKKSSASKKKTAQKGGDFYYLQGEYMYAMYVYAWVLTLYISQ